jgi:hypothetical protein
MEYDDCIIIKFKNNLFQDINRFARNKIIDLKEQNEVSILLLSYDENALIERRDPYFEPEDTIFINERGEIKIINDWSKVFNIWFSKTVNVDNIIEQLMVLPCVEYVSKKGIAKSPFPIYDYKLCQNYPNPFNPLTIIKYSLVKPAHVKLQVYDFLGREIRTLVNEKKKEGDYDILFNSSRLASGIYFYRLIITPDNGGEKIVFRKSMQYVK